MVPLIRKHPQDQFHIMILLEHPLFLFSWMILLLLFCMSNFSDFRDPFKVNHEFSSSNTIRLHTYQQLLHDFQKRSSRLSFPPFFSLYLWFVRLIDVDASFSAYFDEVCRPCIPAFNCRKNLLLRYILFAASC